MVEWISGDLDYAPDRCEALRQARKEAVAGQEICRGHYKDGLKWFQRMEKAITIVLRYIEGDEGWTGPIAWPAELETELRCAVNTYALS